MLFNGWETGACGGKPHRDREEPLEIGHETHKIFALVEKYEEEKAIFKGSYQLGKKLLMDWAGSDPRNSTKA